METSRAVRALPSAEVSTSAGRSSVPGMRRLLCDLSDGVVPTRSLTERATGGVESASDQEARVACGTHCGLHWSCTTQAEAHRIKKKKLVRVQDGAHAGVQFP